MNDKEKSTGLTVDNSGMNPESPTVTVASPAPASSQGLMMGVSYAKYSSPIPPAEEMKRYAEVHHELPQKILEMTCAEQAHRHQQDLADNAYREQLVKSNFRLTCCGVIASVVVVMLIMAAAVACAYFGHPVSAGFIGSGGVVMIVTTLVCGVKIGGNSRKQ